MRAKTLAAQAERDTDSWIELVKNFRNRYDRLLGQLTMYGSEVYRSRIIEHDGVPPYHFVRNAKHRFIFPEQLDLTVIDGPRFTLIKTSWTPSNPNNALILEEFELTGPSISGLGTVEIAYDDAGTTPNLMIDSSKIQQNLPHQAMDALLEAISPDEMIKTFAVQ